MEELIASRLLGYKLKELFKLSRNLYQFINWRGIENNNEDKKKKLGDKMTNANPK